METTVTQFPRWVYRPTSLIDKRPSGGDRVHAHQEILHHLQVQSLNVEPRLVLPSIACTIIISLRSGGCLQVEDPFFRKVNKYVNGCFIGPHDRSFKISSSSPADFLIILFYPGQFYSLFEYSGNALQNACKDIESMRLNGFSRMMEIFHEFNDRGQQTEVVRNYFKNAHNQVKHKADNYANTFQTLLKSLLEGTGCQRVKAYCIDHDINQKKAERAFQRFVGFNPKAVLRIKRYFHALKSLSENSGHAGLNSIAKECGYHDLPHMINEFKSLCGCNPSSIDKKFITEKILYWETGWCEVPKRTQC